MVSFQPLEAVGYTPEFFRLPQSEGTYYTFDTPSRSFQPSSWDIVGIKHQRTNELRLEMQLFHIDEEALAYSAFSPLDGAGGLLSMSIEELQAFLRFLETTFDLQSPSVEEHFVRFALLDHQELAELHFLPWEIERKFGNYYRYHPLPELQAAETMCIVGLPSWVSKGKLSSTSSLVFVTFERDRLKDPAFRLLDEECLGSMCFDLEGLRELFVLLKERERIRAEFLQQASE